MTTADLQPAQQQPGERGAGEQGPGEQGAPSSDPGPRGESETDSATPVRVGERQLVLPEEPTAIGAALLRLVHAGQGWPDGGDEDAGLADALWASWSEDLAPAGMDREAFGRVVVGYRRELWLWILGDRSWTQAATGLAGRVLRRLPDAS
jgi:hypothetical protein